MWHKVRNRKQGRQKCRRLEIIALSWTWHCYKSLDYHICTCFVGLNISLLWVLSLGFIVNGFSKQKMYIWPITQLETDAPRSIPLIIFLFLLVVQVFTDLFFFMSGVHSVCGQRTIIYRMLFTTAQKCSVFFLLLMRSFHGRMAFGHSWRSVYTISATALSRWSISYELCWPSERELSVFSRASLISNINSSSSCQEIIYERCIPSSSLLLYCSLIFKVNSGSSCPENIYAGCFPSSQAGLGTDPQMTRSFRGTRPGGDRGATPTPGNPWHFGPDRCFNLWFDHTLSVEDFSYFEATAGPDSTSTNSCRWDAWAPPTLIRPPWKSFTYCWQIFLPLWMLLDLVTFLLLWV